MKEFKVSVFVCGTKRLEIHFAPSYSVLSNRLHNLFPPGYIWSIL